MADFTQDPVQAIKDLMTAINSVGGPLRREIGREMGKQLTDPTTYLGFNPSKLGGKQQGPPAPQTPISPTAQITNAVQGPLGTLTASAGASGSGSGGYDPVAEANRLIAKAMADFPTYQGLSNDQIAAFFAPYAAAIENLQPPAGQQVPDRQKALPTFISAALSNIGSALSRNPEFASSTLQRVQGEENRRNSIISQNYLQQEVFDKDKQMQRLALIGKQADAQFENAIKTGDTNAALKAEKVKTQLQMQAEAITAKARLEEQKVQSAAALKVSETKTGPKLMDPKSYVAAKAKIAMANEKNLPEAATGLLPDMTEGFAGAVGALPKNFTKDDLYIQVAAAGATGGDENVKGQAMMDLFRLARRKLKMPDGGAPTTTEEMDKMNKFLRKYGVEYKP